MAGLSILQKAACEACWRALWDRNVDTTGQNLTKDMPLRLVRDRISAFVEILPIAMLPRLVLPEIQRFGALRGGYSERWSGANQVREDYDAKQAELAHRYANEPLNAHPWGDSSGTSGSASKEPSSEAPETDDGETPKAKEAPERYHASDEQYFDSKAIASSVGAWQLGVGRSKTAAPTGVQYEAKRVQESFAPKDIPPDRKRGA
jgi:hypothetical protein